MAAEKKTSHVAGSLAELRANLEAISVVAGRLAETITTGARMSARAMAKDLGLAEADVHYAVTNLCWAVDVDHEHDVPGVEDLVPLKSIPASSRRAVAA